MVTTCAEAFIREDDEDTAMKLLLEPVFGEQVWHDDDSPPPKRTRWVRIPV